jgi:chorismate mutase
MADYCSSNVPAERKAPLAVRAIRGAIDVEANTREAIAEATQALLSAICDANAVDVSEVISVFFTMTVDLNADYPAAAARAMGWTDVPLLDAQEMEVPGGMPRVVRVLMHVETDLRRDQIRHVYLRNAARLRPDLNHAP